MEPRGVFRVEMLGEIAMGEEVEKVGGLTEEVQVVMMVVPAWCC